MQRWSRREAVGSLAAGAAALLSANWNSAAGRTRADGLQIAPFRFDVSPPLGHSCCGGWIKTVAQIDDALEAIGFVITGAGAPIVVCAVDWTGLLNSAHSAWRQALAEAAGTTPDRVAVQCVHQHNAPFACLDTQKLLDAQGDLPPVVDVKFFEQCLMRGRDAVRAALARPHRLTHIATGQARVQQVASNRRFLGPDGKIQHWRGSATKDAVLQDLPEGLIDPWLKTVAFYDGDRPVVACHYYATHPMSFYGDGRVTSDFVGLARKRRQAEQPETLQIYFTGCSGNVAAGKYNDGTPEARQRLTDRVYEGLVAAGKTLERRPVAAVAWKTSDLLLAPNPAFAPDVLEKQIATKGAPVVNRNRPAFTLTFVRRCEQRVPIVLSALHVNDVSLLHLPAESFIEYQLLAQKLAPQRFVATAAYGDGGPWYIPTADAYPQGGYEVGVAFSSSATEAHLSQGVRTIGAAG